MPQTLVALVGTNPTPILLSALTYRPRLLVLVHSAGTAAQAARIAEQFTRIEPAAQVERFDLGADVGDFSAVQHGYTRLLHGSRADLGSTEWRLCFTGGTKPMSVVFAVEHATLFPDRHDWRGYVDATGGGIRFTDGSGRRVDHRGLSVDTLAALHGVALARTAQHDLVALVAQHGGPGEQQVRLRVPDPREAAGVVAEGRLLRSLRELARGTPEDEVEIVHSRYVPDPRPGHGGEQDAIGDFDLVVRYRHQVLCVECKTAPQDIPRTAGWTVAKARRVFGDAARVLFVYRGGDDRELAANPRLDRVTDEDVRAFNRHLRGRDGRRSQVRVLTDRQLQRLGGAWLEELFGTDPPQERGRSLPPPVPPVEPTEQAPLLVTAVGGSRLSILGAVNAHRPARTVLVRTPEIDVTTLKQPVEEAMARLRGGPAPAPRRAGRRRPRRGTPGVEVSCLDRAVAAADIPAVVEAAQAEIQRARGRGRPVVLDVTAGSKAAAVALALAAHPTDTVSYTDPLGRRISVFAPADPVPARPFDPPEVAWSSALTGYEPLERPLAETVGRFAVQQVDVALLEEAARAVAGRAEARGYRTRLWVDGEARGPRTRSVDDPWTEGELGQFSAQERPTLVVTVADRAVGLTAPRDRQHRYRRGTLRYPPGHRQRVRSGEWAHSVYAAASRLAALCGVAGRTIALGHGVDLDLNRTADLIDWHSSTTAYQDAQRPRVLTARPGDAAFAADVDGLLDEMGLPWTGERGEGG